jgi:hypothetical protein
MIVDLIIKGLTEHVFGLTEVTITILMLFFVMFSLLINIPVPFAVAIPIPFVVILTAYGYMSILFGGLLSAMFLILAIMSFLGGLGVKN